MNEKKKLNIILGRKHLESHYFHSNYFKQKFFVRV